MVEYYAQRASAGLILSEATAVTPMGGYADTPGIWSQEQADGWREVTRAVHEGEADAVAFGRLFIANPDLPGHEGYTDYPSLTAM